jgi:hypothetical protein
VPLEEGIRQTIGWTRDNLDLIEACIARHRLRLSDDVGE